MSLEELDNLDTPPVNTVDDFEAALASTPVAIEDVAVVLMKLKPKLKKKRMTRTPNSAVHFAPHSVIGM